MMFSDSFQLIWDPNKIQQVKEAILLGNSSDIRYFRLCNVLMFPRGLFD